MNSYLRIAKVLQEIVDDYTMFVDSDEQLCDEPDAEHKFSEWEHVDALRSAISLLKFMTKDYYLDRPERCTRCKKWRTFSELEENSGVCRDCYREANG